MKALVTGGAGFIGSHLAEALCRRGDQVVVLDIANPTLAPNLGWRKTGDAVDLIEGDVNDAALLRKLLPGCDWVFHHAAIPSVPRSVDDPIESHRQNLNCSVQLLVAARDAKVKRFVFASSSAIYGDSDVARKHEALPPNPLSPYALQKYASEKYGQLFHQLYGFETVGLRYFNIFGPRQSFDSPYSGVIARFCQAMLAGQPPTIFGDGTQSRDFTYVANAVAANLQAAEAPAANVAGKVFNVAGGQSISLLQLVSELNRLTGRQLAPRFEPCRPGDVHTSLADIGTATRELNYKVTVDWPEGLRRTLEYYRQSAP